MRFEAAYGGRWERRLTQEAAARRLQQLDQRDNQPALGNQGAKQPFQQIGLEGFDLSLDSRYIGLGGLAEGFNIGLGGQAESFNFLLDPRYIGLGGQAESFNFLLDPRYIGLGG